MINKENVLIGSDFEFFLEDRKTGKIMSAIPFNSGTKLAPEQLEKEGCCIQRDGVLQECNVPPVGLYQSEEFWKNVQYILEFLEGKYNSENIRVKCCASATLAKDQMKNKEAHELGCDADFNAWDNGNQNPKPNLKNRYFRTCGCHFHLSYTPHTIDNAIELVKLFDLYVTVPFILIDTDKERRKLYGKAGAFRMQQWGDVYGVEFRQLSNKCLQSSTLIDFVFNQLNLVIDHFNQNPMGSIDKDKELIITCVNKSDEAIAKELCEKYNILLPIEYIADGTMLESV